MSRKKTRLSSTQMKNRALMLAELDRQLAEGRRASECTGTIKLRSRRKHRAKTQRIT
jgi:hypothetical protein